MKKSGLARLAVLVVLSVGCLIVLSACSNNPYEGNYQEPTISQCREFADTLKRKTSDLSGYKFVHEITYVDFEEDEERETETVTYTILASGNYNAKCYFFKSESKWREESSAANNYGNVTEEFWMDKLTAKIYLHEKRHIVEDGKTESFEEKYSQTLQEEDGFVSFAESYYKGEVFDMVLKMLDEFVQNGKLQDGQLLLDTNKCKVVGEGKTVTLVLQSDTILLKAEYLDGEKVATAVLTATKTTEKVVLPNVSEYPFRRDN